MADLDDFLRQRTQIGEIADFLCRDVNEVEAKVAELRRNRG
jgi:hypothetical protein